MLSNFHKIFDKKCSFNRMYFNEFQNLSLESCWGKPTPFPRKNVLLLRSDYTPNPKVNMLLLQSKSTPPPHQMYSLDSNLSCK